MLENQHDIFIDGVRTHYWEAGRGEPLILLHSGEYGAAAEFSWERNIGALAERFHVFAPDLLGFGHSEKLYSFANMAELRIRQIKRFMETVCIPEAMFIGSSYGGGLLLNVCARTVLPWNVTKAITIGGGGPMSEAGLRALNSYDCTIAAMRQLLEFSCYRHELLTDEYVERRYQMSMMPGAWECTSAPKFRSPANMGGASTLPVIDYTNVKVPVLVCAGDKDLLKPIDYGERLSSLIPNARLEVFEDCGHFPNIEDAERWNRAAIDFLLN